MKKIGQWIPCSYCGASIYRTPSRLRQYSFCDKSCRGKFFWREKVRDRMLSAFNPLALPKYHPQLTQSADLAYIVGVLIGDGSVRHRSIRLSVVDKAFADSFALALNRIGLPAKVYTRYREDKKYNTYYEVQVRSSLFIQWWHNNLDIEKLARRFPPNFVRGFYESEGSYSLGLECCNSELKKISLFCGCLEALGFKYSLPYACYPSKKNKKLMYYIRLLGGKQIRQKFIKEISPCIKRSPSNSIPKICKFCQQVFPASYPNQQFCSLSCRAKYQRNIVGFNPMASEEAKEKVRESLRGSHRSPAVRLKISQTHKTKIANGELMIVRDIKGRILTQCVRQLPYSQAKVE